MRSFERLREGWKRKSIRTKLALALILISLIPQLGVGLTAYYYARSALTNQVLDQLESVATIQKTRVESLLANDEARLALILSRTSLRDNMLLYSRAPSPAALANLNRVLTDLKSSSQAFRFIDLMDNSGKVVASTDDSHVGKDRSGEKSFREGAISGNVSEFFLDEHDGLMHYRTGPLVLDGKQVGVITLSEDAQPYVSLSGDHTGLDETGETVLAKKDTEGNAVYIVPVRFDRNAALRLTVSGKRSNVPINIALSGSEKTIDRAPDYRDEPVLAVTRYIPSTGWGLVTKIDEAEAFSSVWTFGISLGAIAGVLVIAIVVFSLVISSRITRPILELEGVADAVASGDLTRRAGQDAGGEIGELSRAFNEMIDNLEEARETLERKVDERTAELARANEELDNYAYTVAHDLRGPLSSVRIAAEVLGEDVDDAGLEEASETVEELKRSLKLSFDMIENILNLARANLAPRETGPVEVSAVVKRVVSERQELIDRKHVALEMEDDLGEVIADETQVYLLFSNLVGNAVIHNTNPEPRIRLGYSREADGAHRYTLCDNGHGIPPAVMGRIFFPFVKAGPSSGSGIGLATVRKIVDVYGGGITAYNDNGACFEFSIYDLPV